MVQSGLACIWATKVGIANQTIQLFQTQSTKLLKTDLSVRLAEKFAISLKIHGFERKKIGGRTHTDLIHFFCPIS